jgi:hypothetical protein
LYWDNNALINFEIKTRDKLKKLKNQNTDDVTELSGNYVNTV